MRSSFNRLARTAVTRSRLFSDAATVSTPAKAAVAAAVPSSSSSSSAGAAATAASPPKAQEGAGEKTSSPKVLDLCDRILELNVLEMNQLLHRLQARLGITDAMLASSGGGGGGGGDGGGGGGGSAAPAAAAAAKAAPKDAFDIKLTVVDAKAKIKVIKEVRVITGLGLAESKALVEKAPCVLKEGVKKDEAEKIKKLLVDAGAGVELL